MISKNAFCFAAKAADQPGRCSTKQLIILNCFNRYFQDVFHDKTLSLTLINQPWKAPSTLINGKEIESTCIEAQRSQACI